jgi:hypothetical protein
VPPAIVGLLPARLALRHHAVPLRGHGVQLDVALLDIGDLAAVDELAFASGRRINPHIALEVRLFEALERYYGSDCPKRLARLADRLNRARYLWREAAGAGDAAVVELLPPVPTFEPPPALDSGAFAVPAAAPAPTPEPPAPPPAAPRPVAATTPAEAAALLAEVDDRDQVAAAALAGLLGAFRRAAVFAVRRDRVVGWRGGGEGFDEDRFARLAIPFDQPSVFLNLREGSGLHLGPLAPWPAHRKLVRCWDGDHPGECLVVPVRLGDRLAAVLYGDRGEGPLGPVALAPIQGLAGATAAALERCIVLKRKTKVGSRRH